MLRGLFVVKQPTVLDGLAFDPFSFQQDGLTAPEVDVGRGEIVDALVTAPVVVVRVEATWEVLIGCIMAWTLMQLLARVPARNGWGGGA